MKANVSPIGAWRGGTVVDIAAHGEVVLAATFAGIYRSTDGGSTWQPVGRNLPDWFIQAVTLAPMEAHTACLAASQQGWLYTSSDGGETWETGSYWRDLGIITQLVASPSFADDGIVFACTEEDGIFKSVDRGRNWKQASFGLLNLNVASLCFSPDFHRDEVVFAGTDGGGLFRSRNAGRAWRESGEGLPDSAVQCLGISPGFGTDGTVWAGTEDQGLYCSTDGGRTWSLVGQALAQACVNGLYVPSDWAAGGRIVAATDEGLLVSLDGGQNWTPAEGGPAYPYVVTRCGDGLLAGAYGEGIYASTDGASWQVSNGDLAAHVPPLAYLGDIEQGQAVWMSSMEGVLARSTDGGHTWRVLQEEDEFAVSTLVGSGVGDSVVLFSALETALACSRDGGETWAAVLDTEGDPISAADVDGGTVVVGTAGGRVLCSRDGGASWAQSVSFEGEAVLSVAACPPTYAVTARRTPDGAWQLTLRGEEGWQPLIGVQSDDPVSQLHPLGEGRLVCSMGVLVLYWSREQPPSVAEPAGQAVVSCLAAAGEALFAGTRYALYCSEDRGQTWSCLTTDVGPLSLFVASPERLYGASMGGQLWRLDLAPA